VLAPGVARSDRWPTTKFANPGDQRFVQQASFLKIVEQC
jgi:hypothetical protein